MATINAIIASRAAFIDPIGNALDITDSGDDITAWTRSPDYTTAPTISRTIQSTAEGSPAVDSYELRQDEAIDHPAFIHKTVPFVGSTEMGFDFRFRWKEPSVDAKQAIFGFANAIGGIGLKVVINSTTVTIATNVGYTSIGMVNITSDTLDLSPAYDKWYRCAGTMSVNEDTTKDITVTVYDEDFTTVIGEIVSDDVAGVTIGDEISCVFHTSLDSASYFSTFFDNIVITGNGIGFESHLQNVIITFFSDDLVNWSYSDVDYENSPTAPLPAGFVSPLTQDDITYALVRGQLYVCIRVQAAETTKVYKVQINNDLMEFTDVTSVISATLPSPFTIDNMKGITSSYNYLILYSEGTCFWSSTTTPTDFSPSLVSGAGFEFIGNLKANITFAKEHSAGFFLYTARNVIFAAYTGNPRYPWKFREVENSGGYEKLTQVSGDTNTSLHIGVTITGQVQGLTPTGAENTASEVSDFFERSGSYDSFNASTNVFTVVQGSLRGGNGQFPVYLYLDRYIISPYVVDASTPKRFQYAIVYDTQLKRYGKLKIDHSHFISDDKNIYFIQGTSGVIKKLSLNILEELDADTLLHNGIILLGKFQYVRDRHMQMELVEFESPTDTSLIPLIERNFSTALVPTFDGKNFSTATTLTPKVADSVGNLVSYPCHKTAKNWSVLAKGAFDLAYLGLKFVLHGKF